MSEATWQIFFPSKYLSPSDLAGKEVTFKISGIRLGTIDGTEEVNGETVEVKKQKGIINFEGLAKEYVLTKAVAQAIAMMFGDKPTAWKGHAVTLYAPAERWFGAMEPRLRVRGSPELKAPVSKTIKLGRKKYKIDLIPTGKSAVASSSGRTGASEAANPGSSPGPGSDFEDAEISKAAAEFAVPVASG